MIHISQEERDEGRASAIVEDALTAIEAPGPSHSFPQHLNSGKNSVAQWATQPDGQLVIFIHGFGGDAIATWNDMQLMLPADRRFDGVDLAFYGYDSMRSRAS